MSSLDRIKKKREQLLVENNKSYSSTDKSMQRISSLRNELSTTGKIDYGDIAPINLDNLYSSEWRNKVYANSERTSLLAKQKELQEKLKNYDRKENPDRQWWEDDKNVFENLISLPRKAISPEFSKSKYLEDPEYDKLVKEYDAINKAVEENYVATKKYDDGIVGAAEKFGDVFTGAAKRSLDGATTTIQKILGATPTETDQDLMEKLGEKAKIETDSKLGKFGLDVTDALGGQFLPAALNPLGSAVSTATSFATFGGSAYNQAIQEGKTEEQATKYGLAIGSLEALMNKLLPSYEIGGKNVYGKTLSGNFVNNVMSKISSNAFLRKTLSGGFGEFTEESLQQVLEPMLKNAILEEENGADFWNTMKDDFGEGIKQLGSQIFNKDVLYAGLLGATTSAVMGAGSNIDAYRYEKATGRNVDTGLTANEQKVVDSEVAKRTEGKNLTKKQIAEIETEVKNELEKGYISTDTIESVLGGDTYNNLKSTRDNKTKIENEIKALEGKKNAEITVKEMEHLKDLREQLKGIDTNTLETDLQGKMGQIIKSDGYLQRSYQEKAKRGQKFTYDASKVTNEFEKAALESASRVMNDTNRSHEFVEPVVKLAKDKGTYYEFTNNKELEKSNYDVKGKQVNGLVTVEKDGKKKILINVDSAKALNTIVGHETTHLLEGTQEYQELQDAIFNYAKTKGDFDSRQASLYSLYKDIKGADVNSELTADLVGDYLFTDNNFISELSTQKPTVFQKIKELIDDLVVRFKGTKEEKALREVQKKFKEAYRQQSGQQTGQESDTKTDTQYSLSEKGLKEIADEFGGGKNYWEANLYDKDLYGATYFLKHQDSVKKKFKELNNIKIEPVYKDIALKGVGTIDENVQNFIKENNLNVVDLVNNQELLNKFYELEHEAIKKQFNVDDVEADEIFSQWKGYFEQQKGNNEVLWPLLRFKRDFKNIIEGKTKEIDNIETSKLERQLVDDNPEFEKYVTKYAEKLFSEKVEYDTDDVMEEAKANHGTTDNFEVGAYMTTDGSLLNFNYGGYRDDHRTISVFDLNMKEFMDYGAIRMQPETPGFEMQVEPTNEQYNKLYDYIDYIKTTRNSDDTISIDIDKGNSYDSATYNINTPTSKIINDVKTYWKTGSFPKQSEFAQFRYSLSEVDKQTLLERNAIAEQLKKKGATVDESGNVTLYHITTPDNYNKIMSDKQFIPNQSPIGGGMTLGDIGDRSFFTYDNDWVETWRQSDDSIVMAVKVPAEYIRQGAQNEKEIYIEGALKQRDNGIWTTDKKPTSTFYDRMAVRRYLKNNPDVSMSLSNQNEIAPRNPNLTYGEDVKLAIAPLQEEIQTLTETVQELKEQIAPVRDEYAPLTEEDLPYLEQQYNEAPKEDIAPPEIEENTPVSEDEITPTKSLFETRNYEEVGNRKVNAYQYDNPEVKPYFQEAARSMIDDLAYSLKGQRIYNDQVYYDTNGEQGFFGINRFTSNDIAELLDGVDGKYKLSYKDLEKGLKAIIEDKGAENNAASKRIEFYLDKRLREGFKTLDGVEIPANQEYLDLLETKEMNDYYSNIPIGEAPVENVGNPVGIVSNTKVSESNVPIKEMNTNDSGQGVLDLGTLNKLKAPEGEIKNKYAEPIDKNTAKQLTIEGKEEDLVTKTKKELRKALLGTEAQKEFITNALDNAKNRSMALMNNTDTIRNTELVFGRDAGNVINEVIFQKEIDNEADSIAWQNKERQEIKDLGIKARSKESAAVQKYGEKQYINDNNEVVAYGDVELAKEFSDVATQEKIKNAAKVIRSKYDAYIDNANNVLTKLGFEPIKKRADYMRHFQELNDVFTRYGIPFNAQNMQEHTLPTDINGLTEFWSPQKNYFANMQPRKGMKTTYDAITGIDGYIGGIANLIYHTEDIQRGRAFEELIRETYGEDKGFDNLENLPEELQQARMEKIQDNHLSNYAAWVHEWTNNVAGKKNKIDRSIEAMFGRKAFAVLDEVRKQVGSNMIGLNLSSSLTNLIAPVQAAAKTNKLAVLKGTADTIKNMFVKDNFMDNNKFLTARMGTDMLSQNTWQKIQNAGYVFMKGMDWFSSNQIVRSKYYELRAKGMSEAQAHSEAGKFAARIMGDRTKGANAQLYNSKLVGLVTQFQLEVNNQLYSMFYDTYHESKEAAQRNALKTAAGMTFTLGQLFALTHLFGQTFEAIAGYNPTFDVVEMIKTAFGWGDDEEEEKPLSERLKATADQLVDALPYVNTLTGGGRIPIASGIPNLVGVATGGKDQYGNELTLEDEMKKLLYLIPPTGGNQFKKTTQGLSMFDEELPVTGSYTDSGNLRFPVEDTLGNRVQAAVFGQWASENARNYFDNERQPLKEKQIQEYADLDMPIKDYWKYREGLKEQSTIEEKFEYINGLDVTDEQKNIMINNATDREDPIDMSGYDNFANYDEFDYATKNPDKYRVIEQIDTFDNFNSYKDDIASIKDQFSEDNGYSTKQRKAAVQQYINSLNLDIPQKIMLEKMAGGYSIKDYENYMFSYIQSLPMTAEEKQAIHKQLFD